MRNNTGVFILGGLALWALWPRPPLRTMSGVGGSLRLQLLDSTGQVVAMQARMGALTWNPIGSTPGSSPQAGKTYTLRAIVTNKSTRDGLPVNVTFQVSHNVMVGTANRLSKTQNVTFVPGPVATFLPANADGAFTLLAGDAGQAGVVTVVVRTPEGVEVARATDTFAILSSAISYSATVSLTPVTTAEDYLAQIAAATTRAELDAIYAAYNAAAGRGEITPAQAVLLYDAYLAKVYSGTLLSNRPTASFASVLIGGR